MKPLTQPRHPGGCDFTCADGHPRFLAALVVVGDGQWHDGYRYSYFPGALLYRALSLNATGALSRLLQIF